MPEEKPKKVVTPVISSKPKEVKETLGQKFKRVFLSEDVDNVGSYIFLDVLVPAVKDLFASLIENTVNVALFGSTSRHTYRGGSNQQRASLYWNSSVGQSRGFAQPAQQRPTNKAANNFRDLIYDTRKEAEDVLESLVELISLYGVATIQDLYAASNMTSNNFTNNDYGWLDLSSAKIIRSRDGWVLELPKPILID